MKIDRAKFLALVSTVAGACAPSPTGPTSATPTTQTTNVATTPPEPTPTPTATVPVAKATGAPPTIEASPPPPTSEQYIPPPVSTKPAGPFNSSVCASDDVGTPGSCALKFAKECNPFPFVTKECVNASKIFKPKIAERTVACMNKKSPHQLCDAIVTYKCRDDALRSACVDSNADPWCQQIIGACPSAKVTECRGYLSGMTDDGRAAMLKCMKSDCYSLYSCTESI